MAATETTPLEQYGAALAAFQAAMPHVGKGLTATVKSDKGSYTYDYADLTTITETLLPLLTAQGLTWSAAPDVTDHGFVLRFRLAHKAGHAEAGCYPLPDPARSTPQQIGSAITYARRYALCAITGLAPGGDDDDGQKASTARSAPARQPQPVPTALPVDEATVARAELAALCREREWSVGSVGSEFQAWSGGTALGAASAEDVRQFCKLAANGELPL